MTDWVTAAVMASDTALSRKLARLRDIADHSGGPGTPAFAQYSALYDELQNTPMELWRELLAQAEREEVAAKQGAAA
jgi:hypothetical protein